MENSKKGYTPMMEKLDYRKSQGAKTPTKVQRMQRVPYALAIGSIIYAYLRNTKDMVLVYGAKPKDELKKSAKQSTTAKSSTEAEYIAAAEASMEAPALAIAGYPKILNRARHFQRKYHYIREVIQRGEIILKKVHTDDNVADPFTKPMPLNKHFEHAMAIGIVPASSLM
ncbi:retrotransposon protein, putative, ty1-copia subclass [Tanacetum coccineum]